MSTRTPGSDARTHDLFPMGWRSSMLLTIVSLIGLAAFTWPLFVQAQPAGGFAHSSDAPWIFAILVPLLLAIVLVELADGTIDAKAVAVLGVLTACGAMLRLPAGGVTGFTPVFFLLLPAGRVFGKGFGFVLGALTLFVSALLTGGVGPWLPYQMLGAAWVGFFAGALPRRATGRAEIGLLAVYGVIAGLIYGLLLNLWFWPFTSGSSTSTSYIAGAPIAENLGRFIAFDLTTSLGFDIPRAIGNLLLVLVAVRPVLVVLRRAARRAAFGAVPVFNSPEIRLPADRSALTDPDPVDSSAVCDSESFDATLPEPVGTAVEAPIGSANHPS